MAEKAKHAFGTLERVDEALAAGTIDAYDILFLKDANNNPYVGWIDKQGNKVIIEDKIQVVRVDELPMSNGDVNVVYIYNNEGYIWDSINSQCVSLSKSSDLTALEAQIDELEAQMATKVDESTIDAKVEAKVEEVAEATIDAKIAAKVEEKVEEIVSTEVIEF